MAVRGRRSKVLPSELNKVCPERGDDPATHSRTMSDFEVVPNLQQSSSSVSRSRRKAHFPGGSNEKASAGGAGRESGWAHITEELQGANQWLINRAINNRSVLGTNRKSPNIQGACPACTSPLLRAHLALSWQRAMALSSSWLEASPPDMLWVSGPWPNFCPLQKP